MYKLETHLHLRGNSTCGKESPQTVTRIYNGLGYNGIVNTNHFSRHMMTDYFHGTFEEKIAAFLAGFHELRMLCAEQGIDVFFGLELALLDDDYSHHDRKCAELLVFGITEEEFLATANVLTEMGYAQFYAFAHERGWLVIQSHPYRLRTKRIAADCIDGVEVLNTHPHHNSRNRRALRHAKQFHMVGTKGSDFHFCGGEGTYMELPRRPRDEKDLADMLREYRY